MRKFISFLCASVMAVSALAVTNASNTGFVLTLDSSDAEAKTAVVKVALEWDDEVNALQIPFDVVSGGVTITNVAVTTDNTGWGLTDGTQVIGYAAAAKSITDVCTVTLTFDNSWTEDLVITLGDEAYISDYDDNEFYIEDGDFTANSITIPAPTASVDPVEAALESVTGNEDWDAAVAKEWADGTENIVSVADIFKITATANDYNTGAITGLTVSVEGNEKNVNTAIAAGDNVTIAVVIGYKGTESKHFVPTVTAIVE